MTPVRPEDLVLQTGDVILVRARPSELFFTRKELDFTVVAVEPTAQEGATPLSDFGCLPLIEATGKVLEGEWLTVIQHPDGVEVLHEPRQVLEVAPEAI